jgi:hypothetical protein
MQGPKDGRDHHVEALAQRIAGRMPHDVRNRITPLLDDAVAVDGHRGTAVMRRPGSVHTEVTTGAAAWFKLR